MTSPRTDILDPVWWQSDPQDSYRRLLEHPGLWRDEPSGFWIVARHGDVLAAERDPATFSSREHYRLEPSPDEQTMISHDDPTHLEQRRIINRRFTPRAVRSHGEHYRAMVIDLVDQALAHHQTHGSIEVVDALAAQLPCRVTAELIGFGQDRWPQVKTWSERQMRIDRRNVEPEAFLGLMSSIEEWALVMQDLLPQRATQPADDLFTDWLEAGMDPRTMVQETGLLIAGGAETTRTVIARGLRTFVDHPEQWEYLAEDPGRIPLAVEELIRWVTPLNNMFRRATVDTELAGTTIAAGDRVTLLYPAANRDPRVFDDPYTFDVTRDPNPHLAFGHGTHFCLGANLARIELRLLFEQLTQRVTNLRVVTEPDIEPNIFARAVRRFDLSFERR
ncbi:MAG: cytochrome P450 [Acidimicrobiia bacterium]|nr:cytochrome P450 [Acidimicrobiia bacterium]MDH5236570.1 cytochrome P450 [Acidimicrobiia bacterium]